MVFGFVSELRNDKPFGISLSRSAVCDKQKICFCSAYELRCSGQAHPVFPGTTVFCQFFCGCTAEALIQGSHILVLFFVLQHMKKKEFRDFVGISYSTMSKLEKGENTTVEVLEKICLKLGCGINDIMEILPDDPENGIENDVE